MLRRLLPVAALLLPVCLSVQARAGELAVGDAAPALHVSKFVKGTPVTNFKPGKMYVVEFWATWCGPCRASIPHLTEMAKKYKDVQFVGVSVWETDPSKVEPFVKEMGDKMSYTVAMDEVAAGKKGNDGFMAANWMTAAGQDGIPTAFVVNKDSRIAWIGHPMTIDEPLSKIVAGNWDVKAEAVRFEKANASKKKMTALNQKINKAFRDKDYSGALAVANDAIAEDPGMEERLAMFKLDMLKRLNRTDDAHSYLARLINEVFKDDAMGLNAVVWPVVDPDAKTKPSEADAKLALKGAMRADELTKSKDAAIGDTLAAAYHANGDDAKAIETQERVLQLAKGTDLEKDPSLKQHLDMYKKGKS